MSGKKLKGTRTHGDDVVIGRTTRGATIGDTNLVSGRKPCELGRVDEDLLESGAIYYDSAMVRGTYCTMVLYRWIAPSYPFFIVTIHVPRRFGGLSVFHLRRQSNTA